MMRGRCAARTCFNTEGCRPNLKFFSFPKNPQICREWVVNCGREDLLDKPMEQLSKLRLCADHFEKYWFINPKYKTAFIRSGQYPIPTIFRNNLADFMPKSLKKSLSLKNTENALGKDNENDASHFKVSLDESAQVLVQRSTESIVDIFRENSSSPLSDSSSFQLRSDNPNDSEDYTVEVKVDGDPSVTNGCYRMCRLCAYLVYEHKLLPIFSSDKTQNLAEKINKLLPAKKLYVNSHDPAVANWRDATQWETFVAPKVTAGAVINKISAVKSSLVKAEDGLPQHACRSCIKRVKECDRVVQLFAAADKKLRRLFCTQKQNSSISLHEATEVVDNENSLRSGAEENSDLLAVEEELLNAGDEVTCAQQNSLSESNVNREDKSEDDVNIAQISESAEVALPQEGQEESDRRDLKTADEAVSLHNGEIHLPTQIKVEVDSWIIEYENKTYQCVQCLAEFPEQRKLLIHEISDHVFEEKKEEQAGTMDFTMLNLNREVISCSECGQTFGGKKSLRKHIREQHIPAENICEFCGAHYQSYSKLLVHRHLHTNDTPFCCDTCGSSFHFKKELRIHRRTHIQGRPFMCRACGKQCPTRNSLWQHEKTHSCDRIALCPQCGKVLSNPQSLRVHMRTHSSDRPCSCPTCGKSFKDNASVAKHMLMHSASKDYACDVCGRAFYSKALVKQHKLSHSGVRPHRCDICGAAYNRLGNLNQHKKKHRGTDGEKATLPSDLPHECVVCGKRMRSELTLKYHLAKHTGEKKPFDCEVCGKRFVAVAPYRVHMRIHTGERPYECPTCSKTFRSSFTLKQHQALHKDECPYACPYCERKFKRLQSLVVHRRTHTGEKPHRCPTCARAFAQKGDMLKHTKTHTRERNSVLTVKTEKVGPIVMEIEQISDLALSDSEMTSEFLIDMPIVEVETEIHSDISAEIA